ncbi:hypothetical protein RSAG8_01510, partial [Rhizoctonia solani AG-8 WAC10335]
MARRKWRLAAATRDAFQFEVFRLPFRMSDDGWGSGERLTGLGQFFAYRVVQAIGLRLSSKQPQHSCVQVQHRVLVKRHRDNIPLFSGQIQ